MLTYLSVLTGPLSSMGSPITLIMRPRVSSPTGILIGAPVSVTAWPRTRPSVPKIYKQIKIASTLPYEDIFSNHFLCLI